MIYLTAEQVLFLHARLIAETGGEHGVRELGLLQSAVGHPQASFDGADLYPGLFSQTAALLDSLVRNHPFVDGNKHTGIAAAAIFLRLNGYHLTATNDELETFTLSIARGEPSLNAINTWLRQHSVIE